MNASKALIKKIIQHEVLLDDLSDAELVDFCQTANLAYRSGNPIISDADYDFIYLDALKKRLPQHPLLHTVEPEGSGFSEEKVLLPEVMLSTDKAYSWAEVSKWIERVEKSATEIGLDLNTVHIKATPKLDGFAGFDDGFNLYTRGDGKKGSNISRVFERGLQIYNASERGQGAGEIMVKKSYFAQHLASSFEHPRNFQASLIKEKILDNKAQQAIKAKAALFVPFAQLPSWSGIISMLVVQFEQIVADVLLMVDFDVDGVVFEVINKPLKTHMGANRKFHRWQIAFKENKDRAQVKVLRVIAQVGRTGKITPVAELKPTVLSGATIKHASGHHYGLVKKQKLGAGSVIELIRSGLVIPKINKVLKPAKVNIPKTCPSCGASLVWDNDFLLCVNHDKCRAQVIGRMEHFFKILANNDGFGIATIEKMYAHGIHKVSQIYALNKQDLRAMGFGDKTCDNLINQLRRSHIEQVEDWRFLAAFGVNRLGLGNCENLLKSYPLAEVPHLNLAQIANIDGFAQLSAATIIDDLKNIHNEFELLTKYNFNLEITPIETKLTASGHPLFGKKIVFTGKMKDSRDAMKKHAKSLGIQISNSVSAKTNYLVIGEKVGQKKIQNAKKLGIEIITEAQYLSMI